MLLEIDPAVITHFLRSRGLGDAGVPSDVSARTRGNKRYFGMVVADQALKPGKRLQRCQHVRAMRQRFVEGLDWHQTKYALLFEKKYKQALKGKRPKKDGFKAFLSEKLEWYDAIYQDIDRNGYRQSDSIEENVEVALAANGDVLLIDGRHRLILAQLLGLKKIPVVVNLLAESVASFLLGCSDHSTACPGGEVQRNRAAAWLSRRRFTSALERVLGLKNNASPLDRLLEMGGMLSRADAESLKQQLLHQTLDQRFNALVTVAGGRNGKGVLVNAHQCNYFSSQG